MRMDGEFGCGGKNRKMERFLEVCLLILLYHEEGYGYGLIEQLAYFGFHAEELNAGTLYRTLRKMEKEGMVTSDWAEGGPGPRRRVYSITETGKTDLDQWIGVLEQKRQRIDTLIARYHDMMPGPEEG